MKRVILSSPIILGVGTYGVTKVTLRSAKNWVEIYEPDNYSGHQTVKLVGLEPSTARTECKYYDEALILKPLARLEFGKEYTLDEIQAIGVECMFIRRM